MLEIASLWPMGVVELPSFPLGVLLSPGDLPLQNTEL